MLTIAYFHHEYSLRRGSTISLLNMIHSLSGIIKPIVIFPSEGPTVDWFRSQGIECAVFPFIINMVYSRRRSLIRYYEIKTGKKIEEYEFYYKYFQNASIYLQKNKVDIIHSNVSVIQFGYDLSKFTHIPHIWHLREFIDLDFDCEPINGFKKLRNDIQNSEISISISHAVRNHLHNNISEKNLQIYNAIINTPFYPINNQKEKYFLFVGQITKKKGAHIAIQAFSIFYATHKDYKLKLVGDITAEDRIYINQLISEYNIIGVVEILSFTDNLDLLYSKATGLLMCSYMEGLGRVTVEAMDHGCPVIGYSSGGTVEIISHGINGLLFNSISECASMMELILDEEVSCSLIKGGRKKSLDFTEDIYRDKIKKVYQSIKSKKTLRSKESLKPIKLMKYRWKINVYILHLITYIIRFAVYIRKFVNRK